jgi:ATP-binding cassette subfamily C protein CydD
MRPLDPRLLTRIGSARSLVAILAGLHALSAVAVLVQALVLARLLAPILSPGPLGGDDWGVLGSIVPVSAREPRRGLVLLVVVVVVRASLAWGAERVASRAGSAVVSSLRVQVVGHAGSLGPRWQASGEAPAIAVLVTRGLDGLLPYFTKYLPALLTAATVTPIAVLVVLQLDLTSALLVLVTLPLVPIFMILVGRLTQSHSARHLESMVRLGSQTLDLIEGLATLKALGRSHGPAARIRELGDRHRRAAMSSLRVAFLSGMVLELLTTLSVALVAVSMGFRLADGSIGIEMALAVLVLAPEAYLPLRNIGLHFHASSAGLAAAESAFAFLALPVPSGRGDAPCPQLGGATLRTENLSIATPEGALLAPFKLSMVAKPGDITALVGPNGEGKSTALLALAGLVFPTSGRITALLVDGSDTLLADSRAGGVTPEDWSTQCAWVPQRPDLGPEGTTLSLGQRERRAVLRACSAERPIVLLDEPTAHLDGVARLDVIAEIRATADAGAIVVVATHDDALMSRADVIVEVGARAIDTPRVARATKAVNTGGAT